MSSGQLALDEGAAVATFNRGMAGCSAAADLHPLSESIENREHGGWLGHDAKRGRLLVE